MDAPRAPQISYLHDIFSSPKQPVNPYFSLHGSIIYLIIQPKLLISPRLYPFPQVSSPKISTSIKYLVFLYPSSPRMWQIRTNQPWVSKTLQSKDTRTEHDGQGRKDLPWFISPLLSKSRSLFWLLTISLCELWLLTDGWTSSYLSHICDVASLFSCLRALLSQPSHAIIHLFFFLPTLNLLSRFFFFTRMSAPLGNFLKPQAHPCHHPPSLAFIWI